ncbi:MAG: UDP-2,3-diacylglucosamine diphosphatase [Flammeovirgaceae bacterium]
MEIALPTQQKIYFASDFHLGVPNSTASLERERRIIRWLDLVKTDAHSIFFMGDIFDFWFEYKHAIPKGFIRFQGKLAELRDAGISIFFFTGNHDMWMFNYFEQELGIKIFREPLMLAINDKKLLIGHGDGLGPGDGLYKLQKKFFNSKVCQWLFARIHPNLGIGIAQFWSKQSRIANTKREEKFLGDESEFLLTYCKEIERNYHHDFYIFGHRHLPLDLKVANNSRYFNLGEWVHFNTYVAFSCESVELKKFEN